MFLLSNTDKFLAVFNVFDWTEFSKVLLFFQLYFCERMKINCSVSLRNLKKLTLLTKLLVSLKFFVDLQMIVCKYSQKRN